MSLDIELHQIGELQVVRLRGMLSDVDVYRFSQTMRKIAGGAASRIAVDISELDYLDSHALGLLIAQHTALQRQGREFLLLNMNNDPESYVNGLIESTKLATVVRIVRNVAGT